MTALGSNWWDNLASCTSLPVLSGSKGKAQASSPSNHIIESSIVALTCISPNKSQERMQGRVPYHALALARANVFSPVYSVSPPREKARP